MEWINIKDKLPGNEDWVRVCINGNPSVIPCCYSGKRWVEYGSYYSSIPEVSHWKAFNDIAPVDKLTWQYSTKQIPDDWKDATDEEYEAGKDLVRFNWRQIQK